MTKNTLVAVGIVAAVAMGALFVSCGTVPQSEVGFQVGGGLLDPSKRKVKSDVLDPGRHVLGTWDAVWLFPSNKTLRFQDFKVPVTTIDGKRVELQGQMAFRFVGESDPDLAREFAEGLGARKYGGQRPGESNEGWENLLYQLVDPEISATLKDGIGRVYCADFEPACRAIDPRDNVPASAPEDVYDTISDALQRRVDVKLGGNYLQNIRIRVQQIVLPKEVQANVDRVTAEQAKTKAAEQAAVTANAEARAIRIKGKALKANRDLIALEVAKQCEGGERCTIIVDAAGGNVTTSVPARP